MTPAKILSHAPRILTQAQREFYFEQGYVKAESVIPFAWVERLRQAIADLVEGSRSLTESDAIYDLEDGHSAATPRLRRITNPSWHHPVIWEYVSQSLFADVAADLVGPGVKFLDTQMNFKWAGGGAEIKWHQDIVYYPHTNYNVLTIGTYLDDVAPEQGPMGVVPGSHQGELYSLYGADGRWTGHISDQDLERAGLGRAVYLTGPAGSIQAHNCRTLHGSSRNTSGRNRPILLVTYAAADAFCYVPYPTPTPHTFRVVRGEPARVAHHDPRPCPIPPDWSQGEGYRTIFVWQQDEAADDTGRRLGV